MCLGGACGRGALPDDFGGCRLGGLWRWSLAELQLACLAGANLSQGEQNQLPRQTEPRGGPLHNLDVLMTAPRNELARFDPKQHAVLDQ